MHPQAVNSAPSHTTSMDIREATADDCEDVFCWRNDPFTRAMSRSSEPLDWSVHTSWYAASLNNPQRQLYICERADAKLGLVRFDLNDELDRAEISVEIAPDQRGRGYAPRCLLIAVEWFFGAFPSCVEIEAVVKTTNPASLKSFERAGFQRRGEQDGFWHFILRRR